MKRVFFHIHIWKTGGTSFLNICWQNFGKEFRRDDMIIQHWTLSKQQLLWLLDFHDWIRCYSCHMLSGELPYEKEKVEVIGIAFVRDPVNRFISSYNFARGESYRGGIAKEHDFDEFYVKALVEDDNPMWRNGQTFTLGGKPTEDGLAAVAERIEKGQMILLPVERFDESCVLLERQFPNDFKDCSYSRQYNVSKHNEPVSDQARATIAKYMDIDFKLHTLANEYLEATLDGLFPDRSDRRQYVENFRRRCKQKKYRERFKYSVKNPIDAVKVAIKKVKELKIIT